MQEVEWRGSFENEELNALHAMAFEHEVKTTDWLGQVKAHSLGWVTARDASDLIGFLNVPWDGASHAWIQDIVVTPQLQRQGVGRRLIEVAVDHTRAAGCVWLHVDYRADLAPFYTTCGFRPSHAGLLRLKATKQT